MLLNIDRSVNDSFYRYKMPEIEMKVEGQGNGKKTVLINIRDVGKALNRHPLYLAKYFAYSLGTHLTNKHNRYILNGIHTAPCLQSLLDLFIISYVLCHSCRNPETIVKVKNHKLVFQCKACGHDCLSTGKLASYMSKQFHMYPVNMK